MSKTGGRGRYPPKNAFFFGTASRMRRDFEFQQNSDFFVNKIQISLSALLPSEKIRYKNCENSANSEGGEIGEGDEVSFDKEYNDRKGKY